MAVKSIPTSNEYARTPGVADLLVDWAGPFDDAEHIALAAENALEPINLGVTAIGELLFQAASANNQIEIEKSTLRNLGCLLQHLGEFGQRVGTIATNAGYQAQEDRQESQTVVDIAKHGERARAANA